MFVYALRLLAFALILAAIIDKNRSAAPKALGGSPRREPPGGRRCATALARPPLSRIRPTAHTQAQGRAGRGRVVIASVASAAKPAPHRSGRRALPTHGRARHAGTGRRFRRCRYRMAGPMSIIGRGVVAGVGTGERGHAHNRWEVSSDPLQTAARAHRIAPRPRGRPSCQATSTPRTPRSESMSVFSPSPRRCQLHGTRSSGSTEASARRSAGGSRCSSASSSPMPCSTAASGPPI